MHVAATAPLSLNTDDLDPAAIEKERQVLTEKAKEEGKPEAMIAKIVEGQINKFQKEVVLIKQPFVMNPDVNHRTAGRRHGQGTRLPRPAPRRLRPPRPRRRRREGRRPRLRQRSRRHVGRSRLNNGSALRRIILPRMRGGGFSLCAPHDRETEPRRRRYPLHRGQCRPCTGTCSARQRRMRRSICRPRACASVSSTCPTPRSS